jgi:hypothetical protein
MSLDHIKNLSAEQNKQAEITGLEKVLHITFELQNQTLACSVVSRILDMESKIRRDRACALMSKDIPYDDLPLSGKLRIWSLATLSEALIDPPAWLNEWIGRYDPLLFQVYEEVATHEREFFRVNMEQSGEEAQEPRISIKSVNVPKL